MSKSKMKFSTFSLVLYATLCFCQGVPDWMVNQKWQNYKETYNLNFANPIEDAMRKNIFSQNLEEVEEHNKRYREGLISYEIGINKFSHLTEEEFQPYMRGLKIPKNAFEDSSIMDDSMQFPEREPAPPSFDWRTKGMVTPVKNQGQCGSCWAFSAVGALESRYKIKNNGTKTALLSEQQLVDCDHKNATGCKDGWMYEAYLYIIENGGINLQDDYPYEAKVASCRYNPNLPKITISSAANLPKGADEEKLKNAIYNEGPVTAAIDASHWSKYAGGIYYSSDCSSSLDDATHGVVIVGYGSESGEDFWWVKNSWGTNWGLNGYIKMARNKNNHCGIANLNSYPIL